MMVRAGAALDAALDNGGVAGALSAGVRHGFKLGEDSAERFTRVVQMTAGDAGLFACGVDRIGVRSGVLDLVVEPALEAIKRVGERLDGCFKGRHPLLLALVGRFEAAWRSGRAHWRRKSLFFESQTDTAVSCDVTRLT